MTTRQRKPMKFEIVRRHVDNDSAEWRMIGWARSAREACDEIDAIVADRGWDARYGVREVGQRVREYGKGMAR